MAYTVLARRYRSTTFDEVVGQNHVAQTLKRAIESGRVAHAFMFCGTRGTGKTSMARILAKALNCDSSDKPTTTPCGKCSSCEAIARGEDIDVIEMDAASNRGIDEVRRVIENARLAPARSRYKIYIIDEVHAMTKEAFNALLKVLEEPASHVKFILATTEPERVLPTILSRCQRYDFHNISTREIAAHLADICKREGVSADTDAVMLIAKAGNGSMRDALSVLDRLMSAGEKSLTVEMIEQMLGLPRSQLVFDLVQMIGDGDTGSALSLINKVIFLGLSIDTLLSSTIDHLRNLLVVRTCGLKNDLVEVYGISPQEIEAQASRFDPVMLSQDIVIIEELRRTVRQSQAARALLDATIVRLALAEQFTPISELIGQDVPAAADSAAKKNPDALTSPRVSPVTAVPPPIAPSLPDDSSDSSLDDADSLPAVGKVWDDGPKGSLGEILAQANRRKEPAATPQVQPARRDSGPSHLTQDLATIWPAVLQQVHDELGVAVHVPLSSGTPIRNADHVNVRFSGVFAAMSRYLSKYHQQIQQILSTVAGEALLLHFEVDESAPAPAAPVRPPSSSAAPGQPPTHSGALSSPPAPSREGLTLTPELRSQLEKDPLIRAVMEQFNGNIVKVEE